MQQWRLEMGARSVWERDSLERRWTVTNVWGKTEKNLKTAPISTKHAFFVTWSSRYTVASSSYQNTRGQKFETIFLSVFCDWKVYPRVSRELRRENLWVNLATGPSKNDPQRRDWGTRLDIPATELPKQGKIGFLKFSDFSNKILSKNT